MELCPGLRSYVEIGVLQAARRPSTSCVLTNSDMSTRAVAPYYAYLLKSFLG
jgi:hypothetical protein